MKHTEELLEKMGMKWVRQKHDGAIFDVIEKQWSLDGGMAELSRRRVVAFCFSNAGKIVVTDVNKLFSYFYIKEKPEDFLIYNPELDNIFEIYCRYNFISSGQFVFLKLNRKWIARLAKENPELLGQKIKNVYPPYELTKVFNEEEATLKVFDAVQEYVLEITRKLELAGIKGEFTNELYKCLVKDYKENKEQKEKIPYEQ